MSDSDKETEEEPPSESKLLNRFLNVKYRARDAKSVQPPKALQKIFRYRNQPNSQYYFTSSRKEIDKIRDVLQERSPYWRPEIHKDESFKAYSKARNKEIRDEDRKGRYFDRDTARSKQYKDLRARLHVPQPPDDVHTIVDIDTEFYSIVEGRPIEYPFDKTVYMDDIRENTLLKLQAGYREDEVLRIEENFLDEETKYNEVCRRYNQYVDSFEQFLSEDYKKSINMLKESDDLASELQKKIDEFKSLSVNLGIKRRKVYTLEEKCRHTKMFQDFLYRIAPRAWREEHGIQKNQSESKAITEEEVSGESEGMFAKYQLESRDGTIPSLMTLINKFQEDQKEIQEPLLYFTNPTQLLKIFRRIILQNLKSWMHSESLKESLEILNKGMDLVKTKIQQEYTEVEELMHDLRTEIELEEHKVEALKNKVTNIINTHFHDAVASEYAVKFHMCVKDIYEKLIVSTVSFSTFSMLKTLQTEYEAIMMELDTLDSRVVNEIKHETFVKDRIAMKLAIEASVTLKNLEKVRKRLRQDFEPPFQKTGKPVMFRYYLKGKKKQ